MRIAFLTLRGTLNFLAHRAQLEGNEVTLIHLKGPAKSLPGEGFVDNVRVLNLPSQEGVEATLRRTISKDTLLVMDFYGLGKVADALRKDGYLVLGAGRLHDATFLNPKFREGLLRASGVDEFPLEHRDLEVSLEGWFNGKDWVHHSLSSFIEEDHFLTGGLGSKVECMGSTAWFWRHARPKIFKNTLYRLSRVLRNTKYVGPISLDLRGGETVGVYTGFRAETTQALFSQLGSVGSVLWECAQGTLKQLVPDFRFATSLRLSVPPYPYHYSLMEQYQEVKVDGGSFLFNDLRRESDKTLVAGYSGVIGSVVCAADSVAALESEVYSRVKDVQTDHLQYRLDIISRRARRSIPILLREVVQ